MTFLATFGLFFAAQFVFYGFITWNYRAVAQASYLHIFISDLFCAFIAFTMIKRVAQNGDLVAMAGYVLGGACGSVVAAWITKRLWRS